MIDAGITGGETTMAGELLSLLINHPDVSIKWVFSTERQGPVSNCHKNLIGECDLMFSSPDFDEVDVVFCCDENSARMSAKAAEFDDKLRIIDLSGALRAKDKFMYGLCEVNRKFMVHDCYGVIDLPSAPAMATLLPLVPLAKTLLLNADIDVKLRCGKLMQAVDIETLRDELLTVLTVLQTSFSSKINIAFDTCDVPRGVACEISLPCKIDADEVSRIIVDYYSDHNFTFVTDQNVTVNDVVNTNKCLITVGRDGENIRLTSVIDALLKGMAGNAVHVMNLLFGLHERVGLTLKAQPY